jgi:hypothetical protein
MEQQKFKTRDGGEVIIFGTNDDARRCYIGVYYTGERWIPCDWLKDGRWHDKLGYPRGLDIIFPKKTNDAPTIR